VREKKVLVLRREGASSPALETDSCFGIVGEGEGAGPVRAWIHCLFQPTHPFADKTPAWVEHEFRNEDGSLSPEWPPEATRSFPAISRAAAGQHCLGKKRWTPPSLILGIRLSILGRNMASRQGSFQTEGPSQTLGSV